MDVFGFGTVIEKVEQYFGRRVCGALLVILMLTMVVVCAQLIFVTALAPAIALLGGTTVSLNEVLSRVLSGVITAGILYAIGASIFSVILKRLGDRAIEHLEKAKAETETAMGHLQMSEAILVAAKAALAEAKESERSGGD
jgi:hypothetical protein